MYRETIYFENHVLRPGVRVVGIENRLGSIGKRLPSAKSKFNNWLAPNLQKSLWKELSDIGIFMNLFFSISLT